MRKSLLRMKKATHWKIPSSFLGKSSRAGLWADEKFQMLSIICSVGKKDFDLGDCQSSFELKVNSKSNSNALIKIPPQLALLPAPKPNS